MGRLNWSGKRGVGRGKGRSRDKQPLPKSVGGCRLVRELSVVANCDPETVMRFLAGRGVQWKNAISLAKASRGLGCRLPKHVQIAYGGPLLSAAELEQIA